MPTRPVWGEIFHNPNMIGEFTLSFPCGYESGPGEFMVSSIHPRGGHISYIIGCGPQNILLSWSLPLNHPQLRYLLRPLHTPTPRYQYSLSSASLVVAARRIVNHSIVKMLLDRDDDGPDEIESEALIAAAGTGSGRYWRC